MASPRNTMCTQSAEADHECYQLRQPTAATVEPTRVTLPSTALQPQHGTWQGAAPRDEDFNKLLLDKLDQMSRRIEGIEVHIQAQAAAPPPPPPPPPEPIIPAAEGPNVQPTAAEPPVITAPVPPVQASDQAPQPVPPPIVAPAVPAANCTLPALCKPAAAQAGHQLRMDFSQQQAQELLHNHREFLQLSTCSFGRRGRPSYAVRTESKVQCLCNIANISGPHGAAAIHVAHPLQGWVCSDGTADTTSLLNDSQPNRDRAEHVAPFCGTANCRCHYMHAADISRCAVVLLDAHTTCVDCVHHALIAVGATDVPTLDILLATVVGAIAESWDVMCLQVLHAHASSLPSTCMAEQYGEALQQHRLLPGDVELAVLGHALNIAVTVFDPAGLQVCYWGSSTAPTEVCLIRQMGLFGTPVSYRLLDMMPVYLYNITTEIHKGDMPDRATAMHTAVMQLWIVAAGSLRADTAITLIYDYGMKDDIHLYQPFQDHFTLTCLMSTANPRLADKMEAFYIAQYKCLWPDGYNVLHGPPSTSPTCYTGTACRRITRHRPTDTYDAQRATWHLTDGVLARCALPFWT
ncbi:hypothetical protein VOLCADRAFT_90615 [Volvox carteri f. nagariensis]|uniref:Uncharacterized protein n=1 Tax=Volvox carteri f. nagariensis TaxID=3068 RepID=D8TUW0_VOLCA|nr:uncharacterized protein VOLCADRAFT_90615 [Volvox carteri f. nagariensis]EFJ48779.1 hypothetical protein VOLCADRAFT_90615 [Volvox carteri f. nagariensis]|eukprot:XP_002950111.1 hypothetical protein VOLCADRAFT_90615 [Volvox carteri f. nagariensis]